MCDQEQLSILLDALQIETLASSVSNFLRNLEIPNEFVGNEFVKFKIFVHRVLFELSFIPTDQDPAINTRIYRDSDQGFADNITYNSTTYGLHVLASYTRLGENNSHFRVSISTVNQPVRIIVIDSCHEQMTQVPGVTGLEKAKFNAMLSNINVKLVKFAHNFVTSSGSYSRDPISQTIVDIPDTVDSGNIAYHMHL